jgi:integral membrane protein (TIGR01906 family)
MSRVYLSWLVMILIPICLVLSVVRGLIAPAFLQIEYNLPGFPDDPYGFTKDDRLYWSQIDLNYLLNPAGISFLADLKFANGEPVYNSRELRHMVDVKNVVRGALGVWYVSIILLFGLGFWAWRGNWWIWFRAGLRRGGWLTVGLLVATGLFIFFGFDIFFVAFHNVFFASGTWTFLWSDTLIRLFPERFWYVVFMMVAGTTIGLGIILGLVFRNPSKI